MENNQKITFILPEDITLTQVIFGILENSGQKETAQERTDKIQQGRETKLVIIRDTALALFEKKVPEEKMVEFLAKHLKTSHAVAEKIIKDINEKLIPFAKIINLDEQKEKEIQKPEEKNDEQITEDEKKEAFRKAKEELMRKIGARQNISAPEKKEATMPYKKNPDIMDVEKNAKKIEHSQQKEAPPAPAQEPIEKKVVDPYKESVE